MQTRYDFLIVGQGLAGTMLSHFLVQKGKSVFVIDKYNSSSSSNIAAGMIHPITGRRLVKSWLLEEAYPAARQAYALLEKQFADRFFVEIPIVEIFNSIKNKNDWIARSTDFGFENWIGEELLPHFNPGINVPLGAMQLKGTGYLKIKKLLEHYRYYLKTESLLLEEDFLFEDLFIDNYNVTYRNSKADKIIFCEGYHASNNPYFKSLPYQFAKGEILILKCDELKADFIINKSIYIQPLGNQLFRIGSTYDWDNLNHEPTAIAKEKLIEQFVSIVKVPFTIETHVAAVRPTVKGRRPLLGLHPYHKQVGIFNGLGTKGVLLAPFLANHFAEHLIDEKTLIPEVDITNYFE